MIAFISGKMVSRGPLQRFDIDISGQRSPYVSLVEIVLSNRIGQTKAWGRNCFARRPQTIEEGLVAGPIYIRGKQHTLSYW
jgi:hypothetical protein